MKVEVRLLGELRRHAPEGRLEIDVRPGATVAEVVERLSLRPGEVWLATLDDRLIESDHPLHEGDELSLIPPVGGGD